jgi:hypothetical protein
MEFKTNLSKHRLSLDPDCQHGLLRPAAVLPIAKNKQASGEFRAVNPPSRYSFRINHPTGGCRLVRMADNKYFEIPKASVRKIMKLNDEVSNVSGVRS